MATQDKALLMHKVEETLKPRMFANLLEEAVDEIQDHLTEFDVTHISGDRPESDDLLDTYIAAKRVAGRSEKTLVRYRYMIERFLNYVAIPTRDITAAHIRAYFARELERGIQESTVNGIRQILYGYFNWLDQEKLIKRNPLAHIEVIKSQKKERLALSYAETDILRRHCRSPRDHALIAFLLATGCRVSEVCGLNRSDVRLDVGECIVLGKGNKERTVFLDDVAALTLREYLAQRTDSCDALFVNRYGERLHPGGVRKILNEIAASAGVENVHPHRFRRTLVTRLLNRGMPIQEVAIVVGHENLDTTMRYFASNKARIKNSYRIYTA